MDHVDEQCNFDQETSLDDSWNDEDDTTVQSTPSTYRNSSEKDGSQNHFTHQSYHQFHEMTLNETASYKIMIVQWLLSLFLMKVGRI
jgi:hypothetical protein